MRKRSVILSFLVALAGLALFVSRTWLASWNDKPKPFVWKATAGVILDKVRRCKEAIVKN